MAPKSLPVSNQGNPAGAAAASDPRRFRLLWVPVLLVTLVDQAVKAWVVHSLPLFSVQVVVPGFFNLVHVRNTGGAFSLFAHAGLAWQRWLFVAIGAAALLVIVYLYRQAAAADFWSRLGFGLIFGGAVGNLIDRVRYGNVVDFLDFYLGTWHWPAFNVADAAISIGAGAIILALLKPPAAG